MIWEPKTSGDRQWFYLILCDPTGLNDGSKIDRGVLKGATIASHVITVPAGITKHNDNRQSVIEDEITYPANTLVAMELSGGVNGRTYEIKIESTLSDNQVITRYRNLNIDNSI